MDEDQELLYHHVIQAIQHPLKRAIRCSLASRGKTGAIPYLRLDATLQPSDGEDVENSVTQIPLVRMDLQ